MRLIIHERHGGNAAEAAEGVLRWAGRLARKGAVGAPREEPAPPHRTKEKVQLPQP